MKRGRFRETQIVSILKKADTGVKIADLCCKHSTRYPNAYTFRSLDDAYMFGSFDEVRDLAREWMECYKYERPYDAHKGISPAFFREQLTQQNKTKTKSPRTLKTLI